MILHHYDFSPFGEKIRAMFGAAGMEWQSVIVPPQPPRPSLTPMLSGYRKSPIAQDGADLYCDTRAIADEIARRADRPELSPVHLTDDERTYLEHVEGATFGACIGAIPKGRALWKLVTRLGLSLAKLMRDRAALGAGGGLDVPGGARASERWQSYLADLDHRVATGYLGGDRPNHLDFACYHPVWFFEWMGGDDVATGRPALGRWREEMRGLGHGRSTPLAPDRAVAIARDSTPQPIADAGADPNLGHAVTITPDDYGRDATEGVLVAATKDRRILARETPDCGLVHVHFPTRGFVMAPARRGA